jgi:MFS family permease
MLKHLKFPHNSGFILGPGIGGFLAEFSHRAPFYFAGTLGVLAFIMSLLLIHNHVTKVLGFILSW